MPNAGMPARPGTLTPRWPTDRALQVVYVLLIVGALATYLATADRTLRLIAFGAACLVGLSALLVGMVRYRPRRQRAWLALLVGVSLLVAGDLTEQLLRGTPATFDPTPAAVTFLGYGALLLGAYGLSGLPGRITPLTLVDAAILALAAGLIIWLLLLEPAAGHPRDLAVTLAIGYPTFDLLALTSLAPALLRRDTRSVALLALCAGLALLPVTDLIAGIEILTRSYHPGARLDAGWLLAYAAVGGAALHPTMGSVGEGRARPATEPASVRLWLLAAALLVPTALFAVRALGGLDREDLLPLSLASLALTSLVIVRLYLTTRALVRSDARFRSFMAHPGLMAFIKDARGRYEYASPEVERVNGWPSAEAWVERTDRDLFALDTAATYESADETVRRTGISLTMQERYQEPDGLHTWRLEKFRLHRDGGAIALLGVDITERVRAEEEVARERQLLADAEEVATFGSWAYEAASASSQWSPAMRRLAGLPPGSAPVDNAEVYRTIHPADLERVQAAIRATLATCAPLDAAFRMVRPDGDVRHVHLTGRAEPATDGTAARVVGVTQDETTTHAANERLRFQAERLEALHRLDVAILASRDVQEICRAALEHLDRLVPCERSVVGLVDLAADSSRILAARGDDPTAGTLGEIHRAADFPAHFEVVRQGVPAVLDLAAAGGFRRADAFVAAGFRTMLVTPLRSDSSPAIGFIALSRRSEAGFSRDEIAAVGEVAGQVTIALNTETLRRGRQVAEFERDRLAAALEQSPEAVMLTDLEGRIEYVNPAFARLTGYGPEEAIGKNPRILQSGRQSAAFYAELWRTLVAGGVWSGDLVDRRKDGTLYTTTAVISPIRDAAGAIKGYVGVQRDVTAEREVEAREAGRARERSLIATALGTLRAQDTPEETAVAICTQVVQLPEVRTATLLRFELDGGAMPLSIVTDDGRTPERVRLPPERSVELRARAGQGPWVEEWQARPGHPYLAGQITLGLRAQAYAPMYAGPELMGILTVGSADPEAVALLTERLPALLQFASLAGALLAPALSRETTAAEARGRIRGVIETRAFHPVFQPIVDLETRRTVGYEALTRFHDGVRPDLRFDEAAEVGLGLELEVATLEAAVAASAALPGETWLDCNVSPALLVAPDPLGRVLRPLLDAGSRSLVLEITEHRPIEDYAALRRSLARLGPLVELAVDDAGAGFASFRHILELRPRYVKLDYSLVHRIDRDPGRQALLVGMVHFAGQVGCQLIAEGVETPAERRTLRILGIRLGQGYLLGRPAPVAPPPP